MRRGDRRGQALTILAVTAPQRQQVAHRRVRRDRALADLLLDRCRQIAHQSQMPRHPARAPGETPGQFLQIHPLLAKHRQEPALLELARRLRAALAGVQQQRLALRKVPLRRLDGVAAQPLQAAQTLEPVDDQVATR